MRLAELDALPADAAAEALRGACASSRWAARVAARRPFASLDALLAAADEEWAACAPEDWREAFAAHPRIGDREAAPAREAAEQAGVAGAGAATLEALRAGNVAYEERFGHVFLIFARGKDAGEMLAALEARIGNDADTELANAAEEQRKITRARLTDAYG